VTSAGTPPEPSPGADAAADAELLAACAADLAEAIERALAPWVERSVQRVAEAWRPGAGADLAEAARQAGSAAVADIAPRVRSLLAEDVDAQATGPLALVRAVAVHATAVLAAAGVPPVARDEFAARAFPGDVYDLTPGSFRDLDEAVQEPGLRWGAAKAHTVLARRRREGRR
jgi:hypothetical protein